MGNDREWQKQLETGLQRVQEALAKDARPHAQLLQAVIAAASAKAMEKINEGAEREEARRQEREERRRLKAERRRKRREEKESLPVGVVFAAFAAIALYFAASQPHLWWMVFVSLGLAIPAAGIFGNALAARARRRDALPAAGAASKAVEAAPATSASPIDLRLARVDAVCDKISAAIKDGPPAVREIVRRPEETLQALRKTCAELARRERELRAAVTEGDDRRLRAERDELAGRVAAERDEVVRQRFESALRALDGQLAQRAELATAASRLEAEGTRILYTLETLHTQVLRARSADAGSRDVAGAGLRRSLEQLGEEIDAVASALEAAHRGDLVQPVQEIGNEAGTPARERERS